MPMRFCALCLMPGEICVQALKDFKERIEKYTDVYQTITDRNLHYIKLIDM